MRREVDRGQLTVDRRKSIEDQELLKELVMLAYSMRQIHNARFSIFK
jgi:hypothetical protein